MKIIGITGGVGAGKSLILKYLEEKYGAYVLYADRIANDLKEPGEECYNEIVALLGNGVLQEDGRIDKAKMAECIFGDMSLLTKINGIIHPAVKRFVLRTIEEKRLKGDVSIFVIEAALLIEENYDEICDELWYIYADTDIRSKRLKESRGYSQEKIESIIRQQLGDEEFRKHCKVVIDNGGEAAVTFLQIDKELEAYLCQGE